MRSRGKGKREEGKEEREMESEPLAETEKNHKRASRKSNLVLLCLRCCSLSFRPVFRESSLIERQAELDRQLELLTYLQKLRIHDSQHTLVDGSTVR